MGQKQLLPQPMDLYAVDNDPLPEVGSYDVVLDSKDQAVCIIQIKKVSVVAFEEVSEEHAFKEGEGDKTLAYWRQVHEDFFKPYYNEYGLTFNGDSQIVLEEFEVVYPTL